MAKRTGLSERQKHILWFIQSYIDEHQYPPSIREIGHGSYTSSSSVVKYNLNILQEMGFIEMDPRTARGLRVLRRLPVECREYE